MPNVPATQSFSPPRNYPPAVHSFRELSVPYATRLQPLEHMSAVPRLLLPFARHCWLQMLPLTLLFQHLRTLAHENPSLPAVELPRPLLASEPFLLHVFRLLRYLTMTR